MVFIIESAIKGESLVAFFDKKRYINPVLDSALYRKKALYYLYQRHLQ